jgi:hypothetical protein
MSCSFQTWRSICIKVRLLAGLAIIAAVLVCLRTGAEDYSSLRQRVRELGRLTAPPAVHSAEGFAEADGVRPFFYDGLAYRGKPTRVFAWYGAPAGRTAKVPGVVLLHGGGGTAYREWVKKWNEHGFAAIAMALEGQTDERVERTAATADSPWKRHSWAGPARSGIYGDSDQPLADQWMYHAVADAVLANSLIRSFPEVDNGEGRGGRDFVGWCDRIHGDRHRHAFCVCYPDVRMRLAGGRGESVGQGARRQ